MKIKIEALAISNKIVLLTSGQPSLNPRLVKEADALCAAGYSVTVLYAYWNDWGTAMDDKLLPKKKWQAVRVGGHPVHKPVTYFFSRLLHKISVSTGFFNDWAIARSSYFLIREAKKHNADIYIGHNLGAIAATVKTAKKKQKLCGFDAEDFHRYEISDDHADNGFILRAAIENRYIPQVDYLTTSSPDISRQYHDLYEEISPVTILNVFPVDECVPEPEAGRKSAIKLFWFSQTISAARGISDCINALKLINNPAIELHLLGYADAGTKLELTNYAAENVSLVFHEPIGPDEIIPFASVFDIGLAMEDTIPYNRDICLTNKIFTYMQAGLAVIASDTLAQVELMERYPEAGRIYENRNIESLASAILYYADDRDDLYSAKKAAYHIARNELNWENESRKFLDVVKNTLSSKRVLIISPYFPPSNAADMQRIRTSLPYFKHFGWDAEVVVTYERYSEMVKDPHLLDSLPDGLKIHRVKAFSKKVTSKLGLGSLALRSLWYYRKKVNELLGVGRYDLIYFSTTQFPVCVLGAYWKKRFGVPYVIDMQDPWHSEYYQDKPKEQRPHKYWFSYRLHKYLEPIAMKHVDGLISVSANYIADLKTRYAALNNVPVATITFGAFARDLEIAGAKKDWFKPLLQTGFINIVYVGRGGMDMHKAISPVFEALKEGIESEPALFGKLKFYFIGTSYAPADEGRQTILPLARKYGVGDSVIELPDRISYYHTLLTLQHADALFIPGSDDPNYSASKIYPYLLTKKPLLAVFNKNSNAVTAINECATNAVVLTFGEETGNLTGALQQLLKNWVSGIFEPVLLLKKFEDYSAENLTLKQTELFNAALAHHATAKSGHQE